MSIDVKRYRSYQIARRVSYILAWILFVLGAVVVGVAVRSRSLQLGLIGGVLVVLAIFGFTRRPVAPQKQKRQKRNKKGYILANRN